MSECVLVCGGRDYADTDKVFATLDAVKAEKGIATIVHGGAGGADRLADNWAIKRMVPVRVFRAEWTEHGKAAGPLRNQRMLDNGKPTLVIAFPGGRGTADMTRRARAAGAPVMEIE